MTTENNTTTKIPSAEIEMITPQYAELLLTTCEVINRNRREQKVKALTSDMLNNRYHSLNGETVVIDENGNLRDGQNRLTALVRSKMTLPFLVVRNVNPDVIYTIDTGTSRTLADVLVMEHDINKNSRAVQSAVRAYYEMLKGTTALRSVSRSEEVTFFKENQGIIASTNYLGLCRKTRTLAHPATTVALHYIFSNIDSKQADLLVRACGGTGEVLKGDPIFSLYELLSNWRDKKVIVSNKTMAGVFIKTWNVMRGASSKTKVLVYRGDERFPKIDGSDLELYPATEIERTTSLMIKK